MLFIKICIDCLGKVVKMKGPSRLLVLLWGLIVHGASGADTDEVSVKEGDSVTLHTGVQTNQQDRIRWYYNGIRIAQISGDQSKICTDVQCNEDTERFRDRLKLDHQTGSLTIMNTRNTDSGVYTLKIINSSFSIMRSITVTVNGVPVVGKHIVIVTKGDSVTLNTGVTTDQQEEIRWYFKNTLIAEISGDLSFICTDVQCNEDTERFRDRLKLDHQTGSLTITDIRNTDSGVYYIQFNSSSDSEKIFKIIVQDFSVAKQKNIVEGSSIILDAGEMKQNDMITWYFNDNLIALVTGDLSKICTDVQCNDSNERFRDRLKLDYWFSWSLIIKDASSTDSGLYTLKINKSSFSIMRSITVTVNVPSLIPAAVATSLLLVAVCSCCMDLLSQNGDRMQRNN